MTKLHQGQLRKINLLFDPAANDYETIDFNGLYSLLQQIAEREPIMPPQPYRRRRKKN